MKPEQATDIQEFLIEQLNSNGYSDIVMEVNIRLEDSYKEKEFEINPYNLLVFFLNESIEILDSLSNKNYDGLINRLNKFISGENRVDKISVELLNQGNSVSFDLRNLPDYKIIIDTFQEILIEIKREK